MKIFEFHFNPKVKPDLIFDSFCFEPKNIYEKRVGSLYLVGLLKNALPKNLKLLENLAQILKREYYRERALTPEKALKEGLKEANNFLEEMGKKDVSWLGNLSFLAMGLKGFKWNFSKVGEIKIFLMRGKRLVDVEKRAKLSEIEPYPLRVFGSLVSGKMAEGDAILILTKEVFDFFEREKLFDEIKKIGFVDEKILKNFFEKKKEEAQKIFGICLLFLFTKEVLPKERETFFKKVSPIGLKLKIPKLKLPAIKFSKKIFLILVWILVLILGYSFALREEKKEIEKYEEILTNLQKKYDLAESYLMLKDRRLNKEGEKILKEILNEVSPLLTKKMPSELKNEFNSLKEKVLKNLFELNKLEKVEPELVFEFKPKEFIPQKMIVLNDSLYFFSPYAKKIFKLEKGKETKILGVEKELNFASNLNSEILFFSKPDQLTFLSDRGQSSVNLKIAYSEFDPNDFSVFDKNLYFLDKKAGRVVKYPFKKEFDWGDPLILIENEKLIGAKSLAIDGAIWVLKVDNKILKILGGKIEKEFDLDIFPEKKDFSKIFTSPDLLYLFVLEPQQKRIIILEKNGQIFKQFQSDKFDNLLDFSISKEGKEIWILNGLKVYKIKI